MIDCQHFSPRAKDGGTCDLGMHGGKPSHGVCKRCLERGDNTPEKAREIIERYEKAFPAQHRGITGCC